MARCPATPPLSAPKPRLPTRPHCSPSPRRRARAPDPQSRPCIDSPRPLRSPHNSCHCCCNRATGSCTTSARCSKNRWSRSAYRRPPPSRRSSGPSYSLALSGSSAPSWSSWSSWSSALWCSSAPAAEASRQRRSRPRRRSMGRTRPPALPRAYFLTCTSRRDGDWCSGAKSRASCPHRRAKPRPRWRRRRSRDTRSAPRGAGAPEREDGKGSLRQTMHGPVAQGVGATTTDLGCPHRS
jgi:hypothetical protein